MVKTLVISCAIVLGIVTGVLIIRFLKQKKTLEGYIYIDAWDESFIDKLAQYACERKIEILSVRKKSEFDRFKQYLLKLSGKIFFDADVDGVCVSVSDNGDEDYSKMTLIKCTGHIDTLPDYFLVTADGRFSQVE